MTYAAAGSVNCDIILAQTNATLDPAAEPRRSVGIPAGCRRGSEFVATAVTVGGSRVSDDLRACGSSRRRRCIQSSCVLSATCSRGCRPAWGPETPTGLIDAPVQQRGKTAIGLLGQMFANDQRCRRDRQFHAVLQFAQKPAQPRPSWSASAESLLSAHRWAIGACGSPVCSRPPPAALEILFGHALHARALGSQARPSASRNRPSNLGSSHHLGIMLLMPVPLPVYISRKLGRPLNERSDRRPSPAASMR